MAHTSRLQRKSLWSFQIPKRCVEYFDKGAVYTDNTARDITLSIKKAENEFVRLKKEIQQLKIEKQGKWTEKMEKLKKIVYCYKDC